MLSQICTFVREVGIAFRAKEGSWSYTEQCTSGIVYLLCCRSYVGHYEHSVAINQHSADDDRQS